MPAVSPIESFLADYRRRTLHVTGAPVGLAPIGLYLARAGVNVEVALFDADHRPRVDEVRTSWKLQHAGRAAGVLAIAVYTDADGAPAAACFGPQEGGSVRHLPLALVERYASQVLEAATRRLAEDAISELLGTDDDEDGVIGLRNEGLFSTHELVVNIPADAERWGQAQRQAARVSSLTGEDLLRALGWSLTPHGGDLLLTTGDRERALAVLLAGDEVFDRPSLHRGLGTSPVEHALNAARVRNLTWVLVVQGARVRLYSAQPDVGLARRGAATYVELDLAMLAGTDRLGYAWLLLAPEALGEAGGIQRILEDSADHATGVGERLRERIYDHVVPPLAEEIARVAMDLTDAGLSRAYHVTLVSLFRVLFVAYAEDAGLLPYRTNAVYARQSLKSMARELADRDGSGPGGALIEADFDEESTDLWDRLRRLWRGVSRGHTEWGVPAYGGSLFRDDGPAGEVLASVRLTNRQIGPALAAMLVDVVSGSDGTARGPVDFHDLSVREFGTIYEGLLESSLSLAPVDLALGRDDAYVPAAPGQVPVVSAGAVYFHNSSGARKATGSYFTKQFAVEHLLRTALDPTLDEHLARVLEMLDAGRQADAARAFFTFRVADIAMGSGHFLVGAVDHIAAKLSAFLDQHPIPQVQDELDRLRASAVAELARVGGADAQVPQESLLRRQVAKRCVYGVDLNEVAVDLARLALWIHTFVPGLPMSALDHGLVHGNSLTGIGTVDEALEILSGTTTRAGFVQGSVFEDPIEESLLAAARVLDRVAVTAEATAAETEEAMVAYRLARAEAEGARAIFDAAVGIRLGVLDSVVAASGVEAVVAAGNRADVQDRVRELMPVHFPVVFPDVFRPGLARPGFDVVLGNPPWDEVMIEEPKFWQRHTPGIMGLSPAAQPRAIAARRAERPDLVQVLEDEQRQLERLRAVLLSGPYPGLGAGDVDYYKAFSWRYWTLLASGGRLGVVFPRSLLNAAGSQLWREHTLPNGAFQSVVTLTNTNRWVFAEVHGQYSILLLSLQKGSAAAADAVMVAGPFHSLREFHAGKDELGEIPVRSLLDWGNGAAFPLLPSTRATEIFERMRRHPRFDRGAVWRVVSEFHATNDRKFFDAGGPDEGRWPVLTGASFSLWDPDFGQPYTWADRETVKRVLQAKRERQARTRSSAFYGAAPVWFKDPATLPALHPRIVFRDVTNQTNTRTMISALVPGGVVLTNKAPWIFGAKASAADEAFLLGVLSSIPLDWYARRFVELALSPDPPERERLATRP